MIIAGVYFTFHFYIHYAFSLSLAFIQHCAVKLYHWHLKLWGHPKRSMNRVELLKWHAPHTDSGDDAYWRILHLLPEHNYDYVKNRVITYVQRSINANCNLWQCWENDLLGLEIIPDDTLCRMLNFSIASYSVQVAADGEKSINFNLYAKLNFMFDAHFDVRKVIFSDDGKKLAIIMADGSRHSPADRTWALAKLHLQVTLSEFMPFHAHNWVHFIYPDIVTAISHNETKKGSVLNKLLTPHARFIPGINERGIRYSQAASAVERPSILRYLPVSGSSIDQEGFVEQIAKETLQFYGMNSHKYSTTMGDTGLNTFNIYDKLSDDIPYLNMLKSYYDATYQFIDSIYAHIDNAELTQWSEKLKTLFGDNLPENEKNDSKHMLTRFIWQSGIVHGFDHETTALFFEKYGCQRIRKGFDANDWEAPLTLITPLDRYVTFHIMELFIKFHRSPFLKKQVLSELDYEFDSDELKQKVAGFKLQLARIAKEYKSPVPLDSIAISMCY